MPQINTNRALHVYTDCDPRTGKAYRQWRDLFMPRTVSDARTTADTRKVAA